jgi:hypothetical protein
LEQKYECAGILLKNYLKQIFKKDVRYLMVAVLVSSYQGKHLAGILALNPYSSTNIYDCPCSPVENPSKLIPFSNPLKKNSEGHD